MVLVLSNGFSIGCLSAVALNLLLPYEQSTETQNVSYIPGGVHPVGKDGKMIVDTDFEVDASSLVLLTSTFERRHPACCFGPSSLCQQCVASVRQAVGRL